MYTLLSTIILHFPRIYFFSVTLKLCLENLVSGAFYFSVQSPPLITKQPPTDELLFQVAQVSKNENEKPFLIECEAEGEPAPR